ncbi:MAG: transcription termination/antitermination NusG family protein [Gemmataceae bacterium]
MPLLALEPFIHPETLLTAPSGEASPGTWWVLHTRPRAEKTVARRFLDGGVDFFLPLYHRQWRNRGRTFRSYLPLFPGYVFLHGNADARLAALETNLVVHVIPVDDQRQLVHDLTRVYRLLTSGEPVTPEERLEAGDMVQIVKGPLTGLDGKVLKRGKQLRFVVEVRLLGQAVSAEVESWMLEPLATGRA